MYKYAVIVELGEDYYKTEVYCCNDIDSAITLACADFNCSYSQIVGVNRIETLFWLLYNLTDTNNRRHTNYHGINTICKKVYRRSSRVVRD